MIPTSICKQLQSPNALPNFATKNCIKKPRSASPHKLPESLHGAMSYVLGLAGKSSSRRVRVPGQICLWKLPIVHPPPPPPDLAAQALATEFGPTVPIPPPVHREIPAHSLSQRHHHLISEGDVGDPAPCVGIFDASEVRLFKTEIGKWGKG
jgi:hypothetical protein